MKVALCARVSSDKQDTYLSISAQGEFPGRKRLEDGHELVMTFVDEAESGRTADRLAFREMTSKLFSSGSSTGFSLK